MMDMSGTSINAADFAFVRELLRERSAIVLEDGKEYLAESRLLPVVREHGLDSIDDLFVRLRAQPYNGLHRRVVDAMTTNETLFFRDVHPFNALRTTILPVLIERRMNERRLNFWSAACSSGQEPYSLAMLLREYFPALADWDVTILGTDLSTAMLDRAREGRFSQIEINRGLPAPFMLKYFDRRGMEWILRPEIRERVTFQPINLAEPWPSMPAMDIILLRNVMIYFASETKGPILRRTHDQLRSDGFLFLGCAETTLSLSEQFVPEQIGPACVYRKAM